MKVTFPAISILIVYLSEHDKLECNSMKCVMTIHIQRYKHILYIKFVDNII